MLGWMLDITPWWLWPVAGLAILAATFSIWRPIWALLPSSLKAAMVTLALAFGSYLAGRNRGAAGALDRARQKEQANADDIRVRGDQARTASERRSDSGGLRSDDGWRRDG